MMQCNPQRSIVKTVSFLLCLASTIYILRSPDQEITTDDSTAPQNTTIPEIVLGVCGNINVSAGPSEKNVNRSNYINHYLEWLRGGNPIINFALSNETSEEFSDKYLSRTLAYGLIGGFMLLLSLSTLCCFFCDYRCFKSCAKPKSTARLKCAVFAMVISFLATCGGLIGYFNTKDYPYDLKSTTCAGANFIAQFSTGNKELSWLGFAQAITDLTYLKDNIEDTIELLPDVDNTHEKFNNLHDQLGVEIQSLYDNNIDQVVRSPGQNDPPIQPDIFQELGPVSNNNTISGVLKLEVDVKYNYVNDGLNETNTTVQMLRDQSSTITTVFQANIDVVTQLNNIVIDFLNGYSSASKDAEDFNHLIGKAIIFFFTVSGLLSLGVFVSVLSSLTLKLELGHKLMKYARHFLNIFLVLVFAITIVLFPAFIAAIESCNTITVSLNNETIFNSLASKISPDFESTAYAKYIHTCIYDNGDQFSDYVIDGQMKILNNISNIVQTIDDFYSQNRPDSDVLSVVYPALQDLLYGKTPVSSKVAEYLTSLNSYTNRNSSTTKYGCSESADSWFLNSTNCSSTSGLLFQSANAPDFNYGPATCMSMDQYSSYQPNQRYGNKYSACPLQQGVPYSEAVMSLVGGFQNHMTDVKNVFGQTIQDLDKIKDTNHEFMQEILTLFAPLIAIDDKAYQLLQLVGNSQTGIVANLNCKFLKTNTVMTVEQLCVTFLPSWFMLCLFMFLFGVVAFLMIIPIFYLEKIHEMEEFMKTLNRVKIENKRDAEEETVLSEANA